MFFFIFCFMWRKGNILGEIFYYMFRCVYFVILSMVYSVLSIIVFNGLYFWIGSFE